VRRLAAFLAATAVLATGPAAAAADCPRTSLGDIEDEVMCPVCGTPLALATEAPQAQREREFIQRLVERCRSKEQIKRALVAQFGERVLALPGDTEDDFELSDALVYVLPALGFLIAGGAIALATMRWRRRSRGQVGAPDVAAPEGATASRLEADLERYDL
jgi:cytochrome c-type biogenesis protein CcmH/NrfF